MNSWEETGEPRADYQPGYKKLDVYKLAFSSAMKIYNISKNFPKSEKYSLTDQIRRSSRSVVANLAEAYRKRQYPKHFASKLSDSDAECTETVVWLDFALECNYITEKDHKDLFIKYRRIGQMLGKMIANRDRF
jgi:four helix bundle protein